MPHAPEPVLARSPARCFHTSPAEHDLRVEVDDSDGRMNAKIRNAQLQKIPYMLILGGREQEAEKVNVRLRNGKRLGAMSLESFLTLAQEAIDQKVAI